jgi:hypothetical protein
MMWMGVGLNLSEVIYEPFATECFTDLGKLYLPMVVRFLLLPLKNEFASKVVKINSK